MINLLPWRKLHRLRARRMALLLLILPSVLSASLHGFYIGLSYLSGMSARESLNLEKQDLQALQARVQQKKAVFEQQVQQKEQLLKLKRSLSRFGSSHPLTLLPSRLPTGIFVYHLSCETTTCRLVGHAKSFVKLNQFVQQLQESRGVGEVQLELASGNEKQEAEFALSLSLVRERNHALALR